MTILLFCFIFNVRKIKELGKCMGVLFYDLFGKNIKNYYEKVKNEVLNNDKVLDKEEEIKIYEILKNLDRYMNYCQRLKLDFGRILDYNSLKESGFNKDSLEDFYQEDKDYISDIDNYYLNNLKNSLVLPR